MSKQVTNKASNPMSPHSPKIRAGGSVVKNQATGKGGFRPESEKTPDGALPMVFDYTIIENEVGADTDSQEFINHIGDILVVLLDEELKNGKNRENSTS